MTAPDLPAVWWSPSRQADNGVIPAILWSHSSGEGYVVPASLPADAVRLVAADELKRAERRAGHCNGRELNPPCGYCEAVRQCERCELIAASKPWVRASAALAGTTTPTDDAALPALTRLLMVAEMLDTAAEAEDLDVEDMAETLRANAGVLREAAALLASAPTTEETEPNG